MRPIPSAAEFGRYLRQIRVANRWTQAQIAKQSGIEQSAISRLENGKQISKDAQTLFRIADAYDLDADDRGQLFQLSLGWLATNLGSSSVPHDGDDEYEAQRASDLLEFVEVQLETVSLVRKSGNPILAGELAADYQVRLERKMEHISSEKVVQRLLDLRGWLLFEQARTNAERLLPKQIFPAILPLLKEIRETSNDKELLGLTDFYVGDTYYVLKEFDRAVPFLSRAAKRAVDVNSQLWIHRTLALVQANRGEGHGFKMEGDLIRRLIDGRTQPQLDEACHALEGLARAQSIMGQRRPFDTLAEADAFAAALHGRALVRTVQIARTRLELAGHMAPRDWRLLEDTGTKALALARDHGYQRHAMLIEDVLRHALN